MDPHYMNLRPPNQQTWWNRPPAPPNNQGPWQGPPPPNNWNNNGWPRGPPPPGPGPEYHPPTHHRAPPDAGAVYQQNWWGHNTAQPPPVNHHPAPAYWGHGREPQGPENWDRGYENTVSYGLDQGRGWEREYYRHEYHRERSRSPRELEKYSHSSRHSSRDGSREYRRKHRDYKTSSREKEKSSEKERYSHEKEGRASSDRRSKEERYSESRQSSRDRSHRSERSQHSEESRHKSKKEEQPAGERDQKATKPSETSSQQEAVEKKEEDASSSDSDWTTDEEEEEEKTVSKSEAKQLVTPEKPESKSKKEEPKAKDDKVREKKRYEKERESSRDRSRGDRGDSRYSEKSSTSHRSKYEEYEGEQYRRDRSYDYHSSRKSEQAYYEMHKRNKYNERYFHRHEHDRMRESYKSSDHRDRHGHRVVKYLDYDKYHGHRDKEDERKSEKNVINLFDEEGPVRRSVKSKVKKASSRYPETSESRYYKEGSSKRSERRSKYEDLKYRSSDDESTVSHGRKSSTRTKTMKSEITEKVKLVQQKSDSKKKSTPASRSGSSSSDSDSDSGSNSSSGSASSSDSNSGSSSDEKKLDDNTTDTLPAATTFTAGAETNISVVKEAETVKDNLGDETPLRDEPVVEYRVDLNVEERSAVEAEDMNKPSPESNSTFSPLESVAEKEPINDVPMLEKSESNEPMEGEHTDVSNKNDTVPEQQMETEVLNNEEKTDPKPDNLPQGNKLKKVKITFKSNLLNKRPPVQPAALELMSKEDYNLEPLIVRKMPSPTPDDKDTTLDSSLEEVSAPSADVDMEPIQDLEVETPEKNSDVTVPVIPIEMEFQNEVTTVVHPTELASKDTSVEIESSQMEVPVEESKDNNCLETQVDGNDMIQENTREKSTPPQSVLPSSEASPPKLEEPKGSIETANDKTCPSETAGEGVSNNVIEKDQTQEKTILKPIPVRIVQSEVQATPHTEEKTAINVDVSEQTAPKSFSVNIENDMCVEKQTLPPSVQSESVESKGNEVGREDVKNDGASINVNSTVKKGLDRNIFQIMDIIKSPEAAVDIKSVQNQEIDLTDHLDEKDETCATKEVKATNKLAEKDGNSANVVKEIELSKKSGENDVNSSSARKETKLTNKVDEKNEKTISAKKDSTETATPEKQKEETPEKRPTPVKQKEQTPERRPASASETSPKVTKEKEANPESVSPKISPQTPSDVQPRVQPGIVGVSQTKPSYVKPKPRRHAKWAQWKASHSITDLYKGSSNGLTVLPHGINVQSSLLPENKLGLSNSKPTDLLAGSKTVATKVNQGFESRPVVQVSNVNKDRNYSDLKPQDPPKGNQGLELGTSSNTGQSGSDVTLKNQQKGSQIVEIKMTESVPVYNTVKAKTDVKTPKQVVRTEQKTQVNEKASSVPIQPITEAIKKKVEDSPSVSSVDKHDGNVTAREKEDDKREHQKNDQMNLEVQNDEKLTEKSGTEQRGVKEITDSDKGQKVVSVPPKIAPPSDVMNYPLKVDSSPILEPTKVTVTEVYGEKKLETVSVLPSVEKPVLVKEGELSKVHQSGQPSKVYEGEKVPSTVPTDEPSLALEVHQKPDSNSGANESDQTVSKLSEFNMADVLMDSDDKLERSQRVDDQCDVSVVSPLENFTRAQWDELLSRQTSTGGATAASKHRSHALDRRKTSSSYQTQSESTRNKDTLHKSSLFSCDSENDVTQDHIYKSTANANTTRSSIIPIHSVTVTNPSSKGSPVKLSPRHVSSSDSPSCKSEPSRGGLRASPPSAPSTHSSDIQVVEVNHPSTSNRQFSAKKTPAKGRVQRRITEKYREYFGTETEESEDGELPDIALSNYDPKSPSEQTQRNLLNTSQTGGYISYHEGDDVVNDKDSKNRNTLQLYHLHVSSMDGEESCSRPESSSRSVDNLPRDGSSIEENCSALEDQSVEEVYYESSSIDIGANETVIVNEPGKEVLLTAGETLDQEEDTSPEKEILNDEEEVVSKEASLNEDVSLSEKGSPVSDHRSDGDHVSERSVDNVEVSLNGSAPPPDCDDLSGNDLAPPPESDVEEDYQSDLGVKPLRESENSLSQSPTSRLDGGDGVYHSPDEASNDIRPGNQLPELGGSPYTQEEVVNSNFQFTSAPGEGPPGTEPVLLPESTANVRSTESSLADDIEDLAGAGRSGRENRATGSGRVPDPYSSSSTSRDRMSRGHKEVKTSRSRSKKVSPKDPTVESKNPSADTVEKQQSLSKSKLKKKHSKKKKSTHSKKSKNKESRRKRSRSEDSGSSRSTSEYVVRKSKKRNRRNSSGSSRETELGRYHGYEEYKKRGGGGRGRYPSSDEERSVQEPWSRGASHSRSQSSEDRRRGSPRSYRKTCHCGEMRKPADEEIRDFFYRRALAGYCLVEFPTPEAAHHAMTYLSGRPVYDLSSPGKILPSRGPQDGTSDEYILRVDNLSRDVDDLELFRVFSRKFPSCRSVKVEYDSAKRSRGYGFVHFDVEADFRRALMDMQNYSGIGKKTVRLSPVTPPRSSLTLSDRERPPTMLTGPPAMMNGPPTMEGHPGLPHVSQARVDQGTAPTETRMEDEEDDMCDPLEPLDIDKANKEFMERTEVLYEDLDRSRWQTRFLLSKLD